MELEHTPVPIHLACIYMKIKRRLNNHTDIFSTRLLREVITVIALCDNTKGGSKKGIPRCFLYDEVDDLINFGLIERLNQKKYRLLLRRQREVIRRTQKFAWF